MKVSWFWVSVSFIMFLMTFFADENVDHGINLWAFTILSIILLRSIQFGRISWFYTFMVIFFFLGCWFKVVVHHIFDYPFVEPTGNFDGRESEWESYYETVFIFMASFITSRIAHVILGIRKRRSVKHEGHLVGSWQFVGHPIRRSEWFVLIILVATFYVVNNFAGFNVTGIHPNVILPLS